MSKLLPLFATLIALTQTTTAAPAGYAELVANDYTCQELRTILDAQKAALVLDNGVAKWFAAEKNAALQCRGWVYKAKDKHFCKLGYTECAQQDDSTIGGP